MIVVLDISIGLSLNVKLSFIFFFLFCYSIVVINAGVASVGFSELEIEVSSLGTFLRADPPVNKGEFMVQSPTIIDLKAEDLNGSRWISVKYSGEFFYNKKTKCSGTEIILIGLFSKTSELTSIENFNRVPGAINSGRDYKTDKTIFD